MTPATWAACFRSGSSSGDTRSRAPGSAAAARRRPAAPARCGRTQLRAPGAAGGALASLLGQQQLLLPLARGDPRRLDQRGESLEAQRGQPLPAVVQPQPLGPCLQQLLTDHALPALGAQLQARELRKRAERDLRVVLREQQLPPRLP